MSKPDGYRYVRQYRTKAGDQNWALYEVQNGRVRRVGTTRLRNAYLLFLHLDPARFKYA